MKKIALLTSFIFLLIACSKDDEQVVDTLYFPPNGLDVWKTKKFYVNQYNINCKWTSWPLNQTISKNGLLLPVIQGYLYLRHLIEIRQDLHMNLSIFSKVGD